MQSSSKERGLMLIESMTLATLDARKTQTRRLNGLDAVNKEPDRWRYTGHTIDTNIHYFAAIKGEVERQNVKCPYGKPGDRLWVRETHYRYGVWVKNGFTRTGKRRWKFKFYTQEVRHFDNPPDKTLTVKGDKVGWYKRPSIFMPRWASRINLEITNIRVERVQDISWEDAIAEGVSLYAGDLFPRMNVGSKSQAAFRVLWDSINALRGYGWNKNLWVWVIIFEIINHE